MKVVFKHFDKRRTNHVDLIFYRCKINCIRMPPNFPPRKKDAGKGGSVVFENALCETIAIESLRQNAKAKAEFANDSIHVEFI